MMPTSKQNIQFLIVLIVLLSLSGCSDDSKKSKAILYPEHWNEGLDSGVNWGLAEAYPNDVGITKSLWVLDAEDFETGTVTIPTEGDRFKENITVVDTVSYSGTYCGAHHWEEGYKGPTTRYIIPDSAHEGERPAYFVRVYFNFDKSFHPGMDKIESGVGVKGFGVVCDPFDKASTTVPCDGKNWYNAQVQFVGWGPSAKEQANDKYLWVGHLYSYNPQPEIAYPELGTIKVTDPSTGDKPYRLSSYADPFTYLDFSGWHCYEVGMYLNTPGRADGEARFWIDGVLQSRVTNIRYRDLENLLPNEMHLNLHRTTDDFAHIMTRWVDNIVLATRYIGPVKQK